MSQFAREHPELADPGAVYRDRFTDRWDMQDGPKPACPHCHMRSCLIGYERCDAAKREASK